jgi:hypothetical protein
MFDVEPINQQIIIGTGESLQAVKKGKLKLNTRSENNQETTFILSNVLFLPGLRENC